MAEVLHKLIANCNTKSESYIPLSKAEIAQREKDALAAAAAEAERLAAEAAKAEARASLEAKLLALGVTAEELATL